MFGRRAGVGRSCRSCPSAEWINFIVSRRSSSPVVLLPPNKPPQPVPMHCVLYIVPSSPPFLLLPVPRHVSTHPNAFPRHLPARHRRRHRRQADQSSSPGILPGPRRCPSSRLATQTVCTWMGYRGPHGR